MTPPPAQERLVASRSAIRAQLQARAAEPPLLDRVAREHPWALVGGAALGGALIVALRPWRWLPRPPVLASLLSQLAWQALAARRAGRPGGSPPG